jgi:hypothetical protein
MIRLAKAAAEDDSMDKDRTCVYFATSTSGMMLNNPHRKVRI